MNLRSVAEIGLKSR